MTLYKLLSTIKDIALSMPNVNEVITGDIYQLNQKPDIDYSVVCITQGEHQEDDEYITFNYNLFYVDRLLNDESNRIEIQSTGIQTLKSILDTLDSVGAIIGTHTFTTFNERFADLCAGVYCNVAIQIPVSNCGRLNIVTSVNGMTGDVIIRSSGSTDPHFYYDNGGETAIVDARYVRLDCSNAYYKESEIATKRDLEDIQVNIGFDVTVITSDGRKTYTMVDNIPARRFYGESGIKKVLLGNPDAILDEAFYNCANLDMVTYNNTSYQSVYSLETALKNNGVHLGENVFEGTKLTSFKAVLTLSDGTTETVRFQGTSIGLRAFADRTDIVSVKLVGIKTVGLSAFNGCTNLSSIDLGNVTTLNSGAFGNCPSLTSVTIPNTCTKLGDSTCFNNCTGLVSITIPTSVTKLGSQAFEGCSSLTDVYYGGTIAQWVAIEKEFSTFRDFNVTVHCTDGDCDKNGTPKQDELPTVEGYNVWLKFTDDTERTDEFETSVPEGVYYGDEENIKYAVVGDGITALEGGMFEDCFVLSEVKLPEGITEIPMLTFNDCYALKKVNIPSTVTTIGTGAFADTQSLTGIIIPTSVTKIGGRSTEIGAFGDGSAISTVRYQGTMAQWNSISVQGTDKKNVTVICTDGTINGLV